MSLHDTGGSRGQDPLAQALTRVARELERSGTPAGTLDGIVEAAVALVPGVDEASISLVRRIESEAATGPLPRAPDALQAETGRDRAWTPRSSRRRSVSRT